MQKEYELAWEYLRGSKAVAHIAQPFINELSTVLPPS